MELLIIRHGQSEADILHRIEGRADFPLTNLGVCQATHMADWLSQNYKPDFIVSSTLQRASMTAQILAKKLGIEVQHSPELMEFNNGLVAGLTHEEADLKYPKPQNIKPHESYYEQETLIEFRSRAETALSRIISDHPKSSRVAVISHGRMINMLFRSFLKLPMDSSFWISTSDTGIHLWAIDDDVRSIKFLNSTEHLLGK